MTRLLRPLVLAAALLGAPSLASQDLGVLQAAFEADRVALGAAMAEFEAARDEWERVTAEVDMLRRRVVADPFSAAALPDALRAAHAAADGLTGLDGSMRNAARRVDSSARALRDAATQRLLALDAAVQAQSASAADVAELAQIQALLDALEDPALRYEPPPLDAILGALDDDPDELRAVADELADQEARLARQLEEVRSGLERARARERLEERVSALAFEERFFDDGGFRRPGVSARAATGGGAQADGQAGAVGDPSGAGAAAEGADRGGVEASDPSGPPMSEGSPSTPGAGGAESPSDFDSTGGTPAPRLDVVSSTPTPGRLVDTSGATADPTLRGLAGETGSTSTRRRGRARSAELEALEQALQRDLESVRVQREAIEAQAAELERGGR